MKKSPPSRIASRLVANAQAEGIDLERGAQRLKATRQQSRIKTDLARFRECTSYSPAQRVMFFESEGHKYRVFPKGRRLGATRGAAHAFIEYMLQGWPCLWGDTINSNIDRYVERYFVPALKKAGLGYHWNSQKRTLSVGDGYTDFRSADRPENWEGFGYRRVFLNEAGIIMADPYLLENAVMPMMLDFADAELIAAGTPKGKQGKGGKEHLYYTFWKRARAGESGYYSKTFTSFDNPWLNSQGVQELIDTYGGLETPQARQEVFGEFLDLADDAWQVIPRAWVLLAQERWRTGIGRPEHDAQPDQIGVDPSRGGKDNAVIAVRYDEWINELGVLPGRSVPNGQLLAAQILKDAPPSATRIQIDLGAVGSSPVDFVAENHGNTHGVNFGTACKLMDKSGRLKMRNYRAAMYWTLREWLDPTGEHEMALPPDELLLEELTAHTFFIGGKGVQITEKDQVKKELGRSPDRADAVALAVWQMPVIETFVPGSYSFPL